MIFVFLLLYTVKYPRERLSFVFFSSSDMHLSVKFPLQSTSLTLRSTLNHEHDRESRSLEQKTKLAIKGNEYSKWKTNMQVKIPSGRPTQQTWKLKWETRTMHTLPKKGLSEQDSQIQSLISVGTPGEQLVSVWSEQIFKKENKRCIMPRTNE